MDIDFEDDDLARLCNDSRFADRRLGTNSAKRLRARLADLKAATVVTELVAGSPHPLTGDRVGQFSLRLHRGHRLVFRPAHDSVPIRRDDSIDWNCVTAVTIVEIGDYTRTIC
ncbi:MAG: type II toxin-antitoxin system YoeB family toxin [Gammaproteobacteria bacterium]|nr:type II toxin-antitoxin system YoeB family toxin [Gammaproteobacteria bacterium]